MPVPPSSPIVCLAHSLMDVLTAAMSTGLNSLFSTWSLT